MNQTEHYGLNQWDLSDRILMSDFNADNAKLDAALAGKLGRISLISDTPSRGEVGNMSCSFLFDFEEWNYAALLLSYPEMEGSAGVHLEYRLDSKNREEASVFTAPYGDVLFLFTPQHDGTRPTQGLVFGQGLFTCFQIEILFSDLLGYSIRRVDQQYYITPRRFLYAIK